MINRKAISDENLEEVIKNHSLWLKDKKQGMKADLSETNLQDKVISNVNLKGANLHNVDLSFSVLENVNLAGADLSDSDIVEVDWKGVNLSGANFSRADLRESQILQGPRNDKGFCKISDCSKANFSHANLTNVDLNKAILFDVDFSHAILRNVDFGKANMGGADLSDADIGKANFDSSYISGVKYNGSFRKSEYVKFKGIRIENSYGSPVFKRFSQDQDFLCEYCDKSPWLFNLWYYSSMCGRSMGAWVLWSFVIAILFGVIYSNYPILGLFSCISPDLNLSGRGGFTPYYFSIVTFTTLGFGDVTPQNLAGEIWVTLEVIIGYVMLGGLISIFSNKLAQRS
ncbi:MAG: hypothetical protein COB46_13505 [Rhodospirillaceae bacterium]|nr:MAG: hypothetical protein COB46_13505 [Rhodospirillaceae bacterium]